MSSSADKKTAQPAEDHLDGSDRKPAEEILRLSEVQYRSLADAVQLLVWINDAHGRVVYLNSQWQRYTGLAPEGHLDLNWLNVVHADDVEQIVETRAKAIQSGEEYEVECRIRRGDGTFRWHIARVAPLKDDSGAVHQWLGTATDIHDIKQTEESQRFLAEASGILSRSLDYETRLSELTQLAVPYLADCCAVEMLEDDGSTRLISVAHVDEAKSETVRELRRRYPLAPNSRYGVPNVLRTGEPEVYPETSDSKLADYARDAGHLALLRHLDVKSGMIIPLVARGRTLGAITFMLSDSQRRYDDHDLALAGELAHRAALAIDNARLYREAQAANRLRDEFLATVSHELRTPLNAILGWAQLLRDGKLDSESSARAFETIVRNAKSQAALIEDILDVSRIITGKLRLDVQPVPLAPVVESSVDAVRPAAYAKDIHLEVSLDPLLGAVRGDHNRLQQIVWNLVSNAIKFTPSGGRIEVRLEQAGSNARIVVSDTGAGIKPEFLPHVFDRFRQGDTAYTRTHGGLGLGLAIVRHLAELHGGTAEAESEGENRGATFTINLPLGQPRISDSGLLIAGPWNERNEEFAAAIQSASHGRSVEAPSKTAVLDGVRALIVDDESDTRELIRTVLAQRGARVIAVASAAEALAALVECGPGARPDVIVSDIAMPEADGLALMRKVRAMESELKGRIPAIALTAYARSNDRARTLKAGYDMHIAKPFDPAALATAVARLVRQRGELSANG